MNGKGQAPHITRRAPHHDLGVLDSRTIIEVVLFAERLIGVDIPVEQYRPESFRTILGIHRIAVQAAEHDPGLGASTPRPCPDG